MIVVVVTGLSWSSLDKVAHLVPVHVKHQVRLCDRKQQKVRP